MADFGISEAILAASAAASIGGGIAAAKMAGSAGKPPPLAQPPPMPDPQAGRIEAQRKLENDAAMYGRQSTVLSPNDNRPTSLLASVGQPAPFSNKTLGA